jgi:uncharacterized lipoprotein NlpE involved in copper resistance
VKPKTIVLVASVWLPLAGCSASSHVAAPKSPPTSSVQSNGKASPGVFVGTLPCADCAGIRTELTLNAAEGPDQDRGTYALRQTYLGTPNGERTFDTRGRWTVLHGSATDPNATVYQLSGESPAEVRYFLRLDADSVRVLDRDRREFTSQANTTLARRVTGPVGGYASAERTSPDVIAAANVAVASQAARSGQKITLRSIVRAEQQIVAGVNYRLCLDVSVDGTSGEALAIVFRNLQQESSLTRWTSPGCDESR